MLGGWRWAGTEAPELQNKQSSLFLEARNMNSGIVFKPLALGILLSENVKQTYKLCGKVSDI